MRSSGSNSDNRNKVESFISQLLTLTQNVSDYKINRVEVDERNMLVPNNVPLETQVINLLSDNEGVAARALALLLDPGIEKKYLGERNAIVARNEFISFLFTNMRQMTAYSGEVDSAHPEKGAIDIDKLFKKGGADLYRAALAEEAASPEFRYACFLRSTQFYDSSELNQKFIMTIGGASGSGKSFASIRIIDLLLKYSPCGDKNGNLVVFVDGGIVRETSIMRELTRTAARVLGYSGVKGLDSGLDDFDVKEFIKLAAYESGRFNLVVLETFSKPHNRNKTFDEIEEMARRKNFLHVFAITEPPPHLAKDYINFILKSSTLRAYCTDYGPESAATISYTQNIKKREETESKTPPKGISVEYGDTGSKEILARYEKIHGNVNDKSVRGAVFHIVTDLIIVNEGASIVRLADRDYQKYLLLVQSQKKDYDDKNVSLDRRKYTPLVEWYKNLEIKAPLQLQVSMFNMGDINITNYFAHLNVADVIINQRRAAAYDIQNNQFNLLQNPIDEKIKLGKRSAGRGSMLMPGGRGSVSGSERSSFTSSGSQIESQLPVSSKTGAPLPPPRTDLLTDLKAVELLLQKAHTVRRVSECPELDVGRKERMTMIGNLAYYIAMMGKLDKVYPQHIQEDMSQYLAQKIILLLDAEIILKGEFKQKINLWLDMLKTAVPDVHNRQAALNYMTVQWLNQALLVEDLAGLPKKMNAEQKCQYKIDKLIGFVNNVYECGLPDESRNIFLSKMVKSFVSISLTDSKNANRFDASITKLFDYLYQYFSANQQARQLILGSVTKECLQHINAANCNMETKLQAFIILKSKLTGYAVNPDGTNPVNVTAILNYITNQMMILYQDEIKKIISTKLEPATKIQIISQLIESFDKNLVNEKGAMQGSIKDFRLNMDAQLSSLVRQKNSVSTTNRTVNAVLAAETAKAASALKPELISRPSLQRGGSEPVRPAAPPRRQDVLRPTPLAAAGRVTDPIANKAAAPERVNAAVAPKHDPKLFSNSPKMSQSPKDALNRPPKRPDDSDNKYKK